MKSEIYCTQMKICFGKIAKYSGFRLRNRF